MTEQGYSWKDFANAVWVLFEMESQLSAVFNERINFPIIWQSLLSVTTKIFIFDPDEKIEQVVTNYSMNQDNVNFDKSMLVTNQSKKYWKIHGRDKIK